MTGVADKGSGALERGGAKVGIPGELLDSPSFLPFSPLTFGIIYQTNTLRTPRKYCLQLTFK